MAKKFTKKKHVHRARARVRRWRLKVDAPVFGRKPTLEEQNRDVINRIAAQIEA